MLEIFLSNIYYEEDNSWLLWAAMYHYGYNSIYGVDLAETEMGPPKVLCLRLRYQMPIVVRVY